MSWGTVHDCGWSCACSNQTFHADPHGVPISYGARARKVSFSRPYALVGLPLQADLDYDLIQWAERSG